MSEAVNHQPEIPPHTLLMDDLYNVGPDKPLGYLPVETIWSQGENPDAVAALSTQRGLKIFWRESDPNKSRRSSYDTGDLYVYDELSLCDLLEQNRGILQRHQWPLTPAEFVARVAVEHADPKEQEDLFRLIAWAFNDQRPEYRKPGIEQANRGAVDRARKVAPVILKGSQSS